MALSSIVRAAREASPSAVEDVSDFIVVRGRLRRRAKCHPERPISKHGLCRECWRWRNGAPKRSATYKGDDKAEQIARLTKEQQGRCASCHTKKPLVLDHDHKTGKARAMLCNPCNTALGLMHEDPDAIEGLLAYAKACRLTFRQ